MRSGFVKFLRLAVVAALILEGVWLAVTGIFLNTRLAPQTINRDPARFSIVWRWALCPWPGRVILHGVETRGQSRSVLWSARLETVDAAFHLTPLLRRTVDLTKVAATGVDYRQRRRPRPGLAPEAPETEWPAIPGPPAPPLVAPPAERPASPGAGAARPRRLPWTVNAERIGLDITGLWFDRYRLSGPMRVDTTMQFLVRCRMEFPYARITMARGDLTAGGRAILGGFGVDVDAVIHPFVPGKVRGLEGFRALSGRFALHSDRADLFFLDAYFRKTPWLRLNGSARARAEFVVERGCLRPGSRLEVRNDRMDVQVADRRLTGIGVLSGAVETIGLGERSTLRVDLNEFQVAPFDEGEPYASGRGASVVATSAVLDLADPFTDLTVVLDLPRADILRPEFYNSLIPAGSEFHIVSGDGVLGYHLEGAPPRPLHGTISLVVRKGIARFRGQEMRGGFAIHARLVALDPVGRWFDISGTRVLLHADDPPWEATVDLPHARMRFGEPPSIDATIAIVMRDTWPLVALFDATHGLPRLLKRMMTVEDVRARAELATHHEHLDVTDVEVTGQGLKARADLSFGERTRDGILYVRLHGFALGIAIEHGGKNLKFFRPRHWFDRERERRRRAAARSAEAVPP